MVPNALSGNAIAPAWSLLFQLGEVAEAASPKEPLADIRYRALDVRLVLRVADTRRIGQEAAELRVLEEAVSEPRGEWVGSGDGGWEVVEDEMAGNAAEESPGGLQSLVCV